MTNGPDLNRDISDPTSTHSHSELTDAIEYERSSAEKLNNDAVREFDSSELLSWFASDQNSTIPASYLIDVIVTLAGGGFLSNMGLGAGLIAEFGSIGGVLGAESTRLQSWLKQKDQPNWFIEQLHLRIQATSLLMQRALVEKICERPILDSWKALLDYLKIASGSESIEQFRILFLDRKNILIKDEVQQRGTVDHVPLYPREIAKRSLELGASSIIMVHNHPSGDPTPSRADIEMTKQVVAALTPLRINLHDHLIIGRTGHTSLKSEGVI